MRVLLIMSALVIGLTLAAHALARTGTSLLLDLGGGAGEVVVTPLVATDCDTGYTKLVGSDGSDILDSTGGYICLPD